MTTIGDAPRSVLLLCRQGTQDYENSKYVTVVFDSEDLTPTLTPTPLSVGAWKGN